LSSDKTVAIIDGSGVLADSAGINREELIRLAKNRLTVAHFDKTKLSKDGYLVKVEEQDVRLPCMFNFLEARRYLTYCCQPAKSFWTVPISGMVLTSVSRQTCLCLAVDGMFASHLHQTLADEHSVLKL
jgi:hypothetical protein